MFAFYCGDTEEEFPLMAGVSSSQVANENKYEIVIAENNGDCYVIFIAIFVLNNSSVSWYNGQEIEAEGAQIEKREK